nr:MAG TPA: hypothetical protein [Caudoviricetes sp.]
MRGKHWPISSPSARVVVVILRSAGRLVLRGRR